MSDLYRNPTTFGRTETIETYRVSMCPECWLPGEYMIDLEAKTGRMVEFTCGRGHTWRVTWSGRSQLMIRQRA